jgi:hypothetical protein
MKDIESIEVETIKLAIVFISMPVVVITLFGLASYV